MTSFPAIKAAKQFIRNEFSTCDAALLAGSTARGEGTETSVLDLVVFNRTVRLAYRESVKAINWPIEVFVHNLCSYKNFFKKDCDRAKPSLLRMVVEGIALQDNGIIHSIRRKRLSF
ncbi:nucleotidyltransferase domain-containing protein [Virgibacillus salexigens]|uniref:nucleotidyltransferase domain-containing protein n=1 Tax=Virgibacillus salexigens TaxID=61016 RepID=UPI001F3E502C|nr:nucleotidyltransferase domain-containing protein [Virgibacillus salexigens]